MADVFAFLAGALVFVTMIYGIYRIIVWNTNEAPDLEGSPCMGTVQNWDVLVAGRKVAMTYNYQPLFQAPQFQYGPFGSKRRNAYVMLSPEQARQLARWLRIAAAPGISVAVAEKALARSGRDKAKAALPSGEETPK